MAEGPTSFLPCAHIKFVVWYFSHYCIFKGKNKEQRNNSKILVHLHICTGDIDEEKYKNSKSLLKNNVYL